MAHVFISYAHTDRDYARKLADYLLTNGFDVWIDDRIDFGSRWVRSRQEHQVGRFLGIPEKRLARRAQLRTHGQPTR